MPYPLTAASFRDLFGQHGNTCLSIYVPTITGPSSAEANRITFQNLLAEGEHRLAARVPKHVVAAIVEPLRELAAGDLFAQAPRGVAVLATERFRRHYALSDPTEPLVVVSDSFHVRPLLRALESNRRYWLVVLSPRHVRVLRGTREGLVGVNVPGLPAALNDVAHDEHQRRAAGRGAGPDETARYYREAERAVRRVLLGDDAPLVLAGRPEAIEEFRNACRHPHLLEESLAGTFDAESLDRLHERAWTLVASDAARREAEVVDRFGAEAAHGRGSAELTTVARAVAQGRVRDLLLADGKRLNGWFDVGTGEVRIDSSPEQGDDVYDDLAEAVILRGGAVHALAADRMPAHAQIAALYRW